MEGWEESSSGPRKGVKGLIGRDWGNEGIGREKKVFAFVFELCTCKLICGVRERARVYSRENWAGQGKRAGVG